MVMLDCLGDHVLTADIVSGKRKRTKTEATLPQTDPRAMLLASIKVLNAPHKRMGSTA